MVKVVEIVVYIAISGHFVEDGVLKELRILMFAMIGEKDILRDKTINLYLCVIFMQHG